MLLSRQASEKVDKDSRVSCLASATRKTQQMQQHTSIFIDDYAVFNNTDDAAPHVHHRKRNTSKKHAGMSVSAMTTNTAQLRHARGSVLARG